MRTMVKMHQMLTQEKPSSFHQKSNMLTQVSTLRYYICIKRQITCANMATYCDVCSVRCNFSPPSFKAVNCGPLPWYLHKLNLMTGRGKWSKPFLRLNIISCICRYGENFYCNLNLCWSRKSLCETNSFILDVGAATLPTLSSQCLYHDLIGREYHMSATHQSLTT